VPNASQSEMTSEQLERARQLFEAASVEQGAAREAMLDRGCKGDRVLRAWVEQMLVADGQEHPLLDCPVRPADSFGPAHLPQGAILGRFRILRELGSGGMGSVYLAEAVAEEIPKQLVALKVVRWTSQELSRRFLKEQSILRRLQHPNVARFLEAGATEEDRPYFVMEYVDGEPIHAYSRQRQLSTDARIGLFRQVCKAVAYLHQNLVVHRDLKPANVLVTADGTVKLVDFGIAKQLLSAEHPSTANTSAGVMTPDYASPEQIRGGPASTLTDVYTLGVLLYELLTGSKPFSSQQGELHETLRRICEEEPLRPSAAAAGKAFSRKLRSELDNIVLKAIQKEPERRYASVEQFDEDLRRYQSGLPVRARGDSAAYRLRKFITRHKGAAVAGLALLAVIIAGIVAIAMEARIARREAARAESQARAAEGQTLLAAKHALIAQQERDRAERERAEAQGERQKAERRLSQLEKLAGGAMDIYRSTRSSPATPDPVAVARFAQDTLMALRGEGVLRPQQTQWLDAMEAEVESYQLVSDPSWQVPSGWQAQESNSHEYRVGLDHKIRHSGKSSLFLRSLAPDPAGSVLVTQVFDATRYRGKRVRFTGFVRTEKIAVVGILGITVLTAGDTAQATGTAYVSGTSPWRQRTMVLDVRPDAYSVHLYLEMKGTGTLWADDLEFKRVPTSVPLTRRTQPANLDFTERK